MAHDLLLVVHVAAGSVALILGPLAMWAERWPPYRSRSGYAYCWSVLAVALSALALVAFDAAALWWLAPLAVLAYGLALLGRAAPQWRGRGWLRAYAHGQGGSYIALVTALLVVATAGPPMVLAWVVPTLVGLALIERRVMGLSAGNAPPGADLSLMRELEPRGSTDSQPQPAHAAEPEATAGSPGLAIPTATPSPSKRR
jgi:hypothetical protein